MAKRSGAFLIYDPNIRKHNLENTRLREAFRENVAFADIVKGSDEDMVNLFATKDGEECLENIREINPSSSFIMTSGEEGVTGFSDGKKTVLPARDINVVSTIGAGDAFTAGLAYFLVKSKTANGWREEPPDLENMLNAGQSFAAAVCSSIENYVGKDFSFSL
ncbi:MAG: PfkB family carbohydrate kinase [bacterium]